MLFLICRDNGAKGQLCTAPSCGPAFTIQLPSPLSEPWHPLPLRWGRLWAWHVFPLSSLPWPAHKKELNDVGRGKQLSEMPTTKLWGRDRARPQTTSEHSSKHCRNALSYPNSSTLEGLHRSSSAFKEKYHVGGFEDQLSDGKFSYLILGEIMATIIIIVLVVVLILIRNYLLGSYKCLFGYLKETHNRSLLFSNEETNDIERFHDLPRFTEVESRSPGSNSGLYDSHGLAFNHYFKHFISRSTLSKTINLI